jgi:hypothetical protein
MPGGGEPSSKIVIEAHRPGSFFRNLSALRIARLNGSPNRF